jgi:hypothetical protein
VGPSPRCRAHAECSRHHSLQRRPELPSAGSKPEWRRAAWYPAGCALHGHPPANSRWLLGRWLSVQLSRRSSVVFAWCHRQILVDPCAALDVCIAWQTAGCPQETYRTTRRAEEAAAFCASSAARRPAAPPWHPHPSASRPDIRVAVSGCVPAHACAGHRAGSYRLPSGTGSGVSVTLRGGDRADTFIHRRGATNQPPHARGGAA